MNDGNYIEISKSALFLKKFYIYVPDKDGDFRHLDELTYIDEDYRTIEQALKTARYLQHASIWFDLPIVITTYKKLPDGGYDCVLYPADDDADVIYYKLMEE